MFLQGRSPELSTGNKTKSSMTCEVRLCVCVCVTITFLSFHQEHKKHALNLKHPCMYVVCVWVLVINTPPPPSASELKLTPTKDKLLHCLWLQPAGVEISEIPKVHMRSLNKLTHVWKQKWMFEWFWCGARQWNVKLFFNRLINLILVWSISLI